MKLVRVALDLPLPRLFDYLAPDAQTSDIGCRVAVPFGSGSKIGIVLEVTTATDQPLEKLKAVQTILRDMPPLPASFLALCEFCARYYQAPIGEVMAFALPPMLRRGKLPRARKNSPSPQPSPARGEGVTPSAENGLRRREIDGVLPAPTGESGYALAPSPLAGEGRGEGQTGL